MSAATRYFDWGRGRWGLGAKTYVMGVVNVTPDSFSDGGAYLRPEDALRHADQLIADGADMLDLGGESTRPGHRPVSAEEEWRRLEPVLKALRRRWDGPISVDTYKGEIARRAVEEGADVINDIWGGQKDPTLWEVLAGCRVGYVLMYNRSPEFPPGAVDLGEIKASLVQALGALSALGIAGQRVLVDPGLGFAYGVEDNWTVLRALGEFSGLGAGLLLGPSRKRFLGAVTGRPPEERDVATAAVAALAVPYQIDVVRVHNVAAAKDALAVADRWWRRG